MLFPRRSTSGGQSAGRVRTALGAVVTLLVAVLELSLLAFSDDLVWAAHWEKDVQLRQLFEFT